jgi:2-(1,2-epoxy-1,2-dihydrophenyl)acetyl-CoA isomerase
MPKTVLLDVADGVATVTLNRPEAGNALNMEMGRDLLEAALACEFDPKVRAVVLTGTGRNFGFGGDVRGMSEQGEGVAAFLNELTTYIHGAISCFARMKAPVVAAVNGTAAGGAVGLVCMADLAIAGRGSKFTLAYTGIGLAPDCSTSFLLPRIVGRRRAIELFLTNRVLTAEEALGWGLVNQVVDDAEVLPPASRPRWRPRPAPSRRSRCTRTASRACAPSSRSASRTTDFPRWRRAPDAGVVLRCNNATGAPDHDRRIHPRRRAHPAWPRAAGRLAASDHPRRTRRADARRAA